MKPKKVSKPVKALKAWVVFYNGTPFLGERGLIFKSRETARQEAPAYWMKAVQVLITPLK